MIVAPANGAANREIIRAELMNFMVMYVILQDRVRCRGYIEKSQVRKTTSSSKHEWKRPRRKGQQVRRSAQNVSRTLVVDTYEMLT
mmetsp:Transcript_1678/g.2008  ORF Transcript_1678/g.2008 Transcript_1678/m.2008 type:complete len:86 (-) Transcript_1678:275-532(-)